MVRPLKVNGLSELHSLRRRVRRQFSLERISRTDAVYLEQRIDEMEIRIKEMNEEDEAVEDLGGEL